jgi:hypothetical protein
MWSINAGKEDGTIGLPKQALNSLVLGQFPQALQYA